MLHFWVTCESPKPRQVILLRACELAIWLGNLLILSCQQEEPNSCMRKYLGFPGQASRFEMPLRLAGPLPYAPDVILGEESLLLIGFNGRNASRLRGNPTS